MKLHMKIMVVMKLLLNKLVVVVTLNLRTSIVLILLMYLLKFLLMVLKNLLMVLMVLLVLLVLMVLPVPSYQVNSNLALKIVIHVILILYVTVVLLDSIYLLKVTNVLLIWHLTNSLMRIWLLQIVWQVVMPVLMD